MPLPIFCFLGTCCITVLDIPGFITWRRFGRVGFSISTRIRLENAFPPGLLFPDIFVRAISTAVMAGFDLIFHFIGPRVLMRVFPDLRFRDIIA